MTRVWPALWPPWKRTTTSARSQSQSTILPLPSSPHWEPTTATLAMLLLLDRQRAAGLQIVTAAEATGFAARLGDGFEPGNGDPPFLAPTGGRSSGGRRRQEEPSARLRHGHGSEQRVEIEGEARRRFSLATEIAPAPADLAPHPARQQGEADAAVIFQASMLDGIDRQNKIGRGRQKQVDDLGQALSFLLRRGWQLQALESGERTPRGPCRAQQPGEELAMRPGEARDGGGIAPIEGRDQPTRLRPIEAKAPY